MKRKINNYLTFVDNPEDVVYLNSKLFPVNMRLFKSSRDYKNFIICACSVIEDYLRAHYEDYSRPYGMSGANCAIPFNIIAFYQNRGEKDERVITMLNPKIIRRSGTCVKAKSNCGSVRLKKEICVNRHESVTVVWYDLQGKKRRGIFKREDGGFTVQHEIDHNAGVLITHRRQA